MQGGRLCWLAYGSSTPGSAAHLAPQARRLSVRETRGKEVRVHGRTLDPCGWMGSCMVTPVVVRLRGTCLRGGECPVSLSLAKIRWAGLAGLRLTRHPEPFDQDAHHGGGQEVHRCTEEARGAYPKIAPDLDTWREVAYRNMGVCRCRLFKPKQNPKQSPSAPRSALRRTGPYRTLRRKPRWQRWWMPGA